MSPGAPALLGGPSALVDDVVVVETATVSPAAPAPSAADMYEGASIGSAKADSGIAMLLARTSVSTSPANLLRPPVRT
jgi:hypothetical protein